MLVTIAYESGTTLQVTHKRVELRGPWLVHFAVARFVHKLLWDVPDRHDVVPVAVRVSK